MGVSNAPGGVVDANRLLLLRDGVGLLTAGGGPSGGVGCRGAGDMAGAQRLTLSSVSWFYGLPMIHKPETPLRPIVLAIGSPTYKFVTSIISPLADLPLSRIRSTSLK